MNATILCALCPTTSEGCRREADENHDLVPGAVVEVLR